MKKMTLEEKSTYLLDYLGVNEEFINGAIIIGGWNADTINRIVYYETGYLTFENWYDGEVLNNEQ